MSVISGWMRINNIDSIETNKFGVKISYAQHHCHGYSGKVSSQWDPEVHIPLSEQLYLKYIYIYIWLSMRIIKHDPL